MDDNINDVSINNTELINRLKLQRSELLDLLFALEDSLCATGHLKKETLQKQPKPQNGIRINGKLSFRGIEKARELFSSRIDSNDDGLVSFEDYRGIIFRESYIVNNLTLSQQ